MQTISYREREPIDSLYALDSEKERYRGVEYKSNIPLQSKIKVSEPLRVIHEKPESSKGTPERKVAPPVQVTERHSVSITGSLERNKGAVKTPGSRGKSITNESNMFSRMSELHSDGSILRRNNVRFGIRFREKSDPSYVVGGESALASGLYKPNSFEPAKKNVVSRVLVGEEALEAEKGRLVHVVTKFNSFHFLVEGALGYLKEMVGGSLTTERDKVEGWDGAEELFERCQEGGREGFDVGFVLARKQELQLINVALLPEDYYLVVVEGEEGPERLEVQE